MHKTWRIDGRIITATTITVGAAPSESPNPRDSEITPQERKERLLAFLNRTFSAAIVTAME